MAIKLSTNFALNSRQALDARNQFNTLADLKAVTDAVMDDGHLAYCLADKKYYVYDSGNKVDANVGKWRELQTTVPGKGEAGGVASLGSDGKVPASQLPSYVDDVIDFGGILPFISMNGSEPTPEMAGLSQEHAIPANLKCVTWTKDGAKKAAFYYSYDNKYYNTPIPPALEGGKIYVDVNTDTSYRWSGTALVAIGGDVDLSNYATKDKAGGFLTISQGPSDLWISLRSIASPGKESLSSIQIVPVAKDRPGLMTSADKGKLDAIGFVGYSLGIQGNTLNFTRVKEGGSSEVQAVTLPSGGTADGKLEDKDINDAITEAFK